MIDALPAAAWTAITAIVGAFIAWMAGRSKNRADVTSVLSDTSIQWINELRGEIGRLRAEIVALEAEVAACEERSDRIDGLHGNLVSWLREQGLDFPGEHEREG